MPEKSPFLGANLKVVVLSILAATTFWFFNALNKNYSARINYPINFEFERDSVIVTKKLPEYVLIDVSSGGWNLLRKTFWFNITPIVINLDNPTEVKFLTRTSLLPIVSDQLTDLNLNYLITDTLNIDIEPVNSKMVSLKVDSLELSLATNHRLTSPIIISPDSIEIIGPKSYIKGFPSTFYLEISKQKINQRFDRPVAVNLPKPTMLKAVPEEVTVLFEVEEFVEINLPVRLEKVNFPSDSSAYLLDSAVNVNCWVKSSEQKSIKPSDFMLIADLTMINKKDSTLLPIMINFPESAYDMVYAPDTLKVQLRGKRK